MSYLGRFVAGVSLLALLPAAYSQGLGSITGFVKDPSGAGVPARR